MYYNISVFRHIQNTLTYDAAEILYLDAMMVYYCISGWSHTIETTLKPLKTRLNQAVKVLDN